MISAQGADVLAHAESNGRYVTGERCVIAMAEAGLLLDHGAQQLAGGDHYLTPTANGRDALAEWRAAQPKPRKHRRRSKAFAAWENYQEAYGRITFPAFLKKVWPNLDGEVRRGGSAIQPLTTCRTNP